MLTITTTDQDKYNQKRVIVEKSFGLRGEHGEFRTLAGQSNMNVEIYVGSLNNAMAIKAAYLATGEYEDQSKEPFLVKPVEINADTKVSLIVPVEEIEDNDDGWVATILGGDCMTVAKIGEEGDYFDKNLADALHSVKQMYEDGYVELS